MIIRLGIVKPLETRKFIVASRRFLGSTEAEVIKMWTEVLVSSVAVGCCCGSMLVHKDVGRGASEC